MKSAACSPSARVIPTAPFALPLVMGILIALLLPATAFAAQDATGSGKLASGSLASQSVARYYDCDVPNLRIAIIDDKVAYVGQYFGAGDFSIPSTVVVQGKKWKLTGVASFAFEYCDELTSVSIPSSITILEEGAFYGCTKLASVTGCAGLKTIEADAFAYCTNLTSFPFGKKLRSIKANAFLGTGVKKGAFPRYLVSYPDGSYRCVDARLHVRGQNNYKYAFQVLDKVNKERAKNGLSKLTMDKDLLKVAMKRAAETTVYFSHTRPNGTQCFTAGNFYGENIALGQASPSSVMSSWMNSPGHRANILGSSYKTIGIGCFVVNHQYYWVQVFGIGKAAKASKPKNKTVTQAVDYSTDIGKLKLSVRPTTVAKGKSTQLQVICSQGYFSVPILAKSFTYKSSKPKVAVVNSKGKVKGKKAGKTKVKFTVKTGNLSFSRNIKVK